jgi:uncharacterized membrane protein YcjF (UPF0283 family)
MRERDDGGGRQVVAPMSSAIVGDEVRASLLAERGEREEVELTQAVEEQGLRGSVFFGNTFSGLVILLGGILTLYLYAQTVVLVGTILTYPTWIQYPAMGLLIFLVVIVGWSIVGFVTTYYRLRRNRQIQLAAIEDLMSRKLSEEATAKKKEAKIQLTEYLRRFDLESRRFEKTLLQVGMTDQEVRTLGMNRERLMSGEFEDTQRWLEEFREGFQGVLDAGAERIIGKYMKRIGIATAAVPKGVVDSLIVTWGSMNMLKELCTVYNLRVGRIGTFVLLGRVFRNVFIAGEVGDVTNALVQDLSQRIHDGIGVTSDALTSVAASAGGKVLGRASEGIVNALLIRRLGYGAKKILQACGDT